MLETLAFLFVVFLVATSVSLLTRSLSGRTKVESRPGEFHTASEGTPEELTGSESESESESESQEILSTSKAGPTETPAEEVIPEKYLKTLTERLPTAKVKLKLLVCLKKTNYGTIKRFNHASSEDGLHNGPYNVYATFVSHIKVEQTFDLTKSEDVRWAVHNLVDLTNNADCQLVDHVYECAINHDPSTYPQYDYRNLGELETLTYYNLDHVLYEVRDGEYAGVTVVDECDEWDYEDVIDGFNIGFEGVSRPDDFESIEILWDHKYNGILISVIGNSDKKASHRRFPLKSAKKALDFLTQIEGSKMDKANH